MTLSSKIGIGTVQFGIDYGISNSNGVTQSTEVARILQLAKAKEISYIDTAFAYGNAEEVIGNCDIKEFKVISKFITPTKDRPISFQLNKSLVRLKTDSLYGYMAHRPLDLLVDKTIWSELTALKKESRIKKIGFSLNEVDEIHRLLDAGFEPDIVQVPYNYFDDRFYSVMIALKQGGCEIHARSTFLQGLFFCKPDNLPSFFDSVKPILQDLQKKYRKKLLGMLLHYSLDKDYIDKVIIGVNNKKQLQENIGALATVHEKLKPLDKGIKDEILIPSLWPKN